MTPATARSPRRRTVRRGVAPHAPRRISGPARPRPVALHGGAVALPRRGTTGLFERIRALPDHRLVDRLLRSRLWVWMIGLALLGIVAMQVSMLKLNSGISRAVETTATLERSNARLESQIARLAAPNRIQRGAERLGMVAPPPGDVGYLRARPTDAARAVERMQPPSAEAAALLANGGLVPGSLAAPVEPTTTAEPTTTTTTTVQTTDPAAAVAPAPTTTTTTTAATAAGAG